MSSKWAVKKAEEFYSRHPALGERLRRPSSQALLREKLAAAFDEFSQEQQVPAFKFTIGQAVGWKLVPGSRVVLHERLQRQVANGSVLLSYVGNVAIWKDDDFVPMLKPIEFQEHELDEYVAPT